MKKRLDQKAQIEKARENIKPKLYSDLLESLELRDIYLTGAKATLRSRDMGDKNTWQLNESTNLLSNDGSKAIVEVVYDLTARSGRLILVKLEVKYAVEFCSTKKLPEDFFTLYNAYSLPLQTFPYFRECANTLFSRMGIPPLVLPLRKFLVGGNK